jgi:hypothetical protein
MFGGVKHSNLFNQSFIKAKKVLNINLWGLYDKTLWIFNLPEKVKFCCKVMSSGLDKHNSLNKTNTLAYYGVSALRVCNVFILQAPGRIVVSCLYWLGPIDIILKIDWLMACTAPCLVWLVLLVAAAKIPLEKQGLVAEA